MSFIDKNPLILEAIEESPNSRPLSKAEDMKDLNFAKLLDQQLQHPSPRMNDVSQIDDNMDEEDDGLPKTCEANDILVQKDPAEQQQDQE